MTGFLKSVPISEVFEINPCFGRNSLKDDDIVSFVPMAAVDEKKGIIIRQEQRKLKSVTKGFTPFCDGDVLFAKITPCMENGKSAIARNLTNGYGFGSTEFHVLRAKDLIMPEWGHFFIRRAEFRHAASINMTGSAGQKRVPRQFFDRALIPVPSLEVQKEMIDIFIRAESALEKRREATRLLSDFLKSTFLDMFGDITNNSKKWPLCKLSDLGEWASGGTPSRNKPEYFQGSIPWYSAGELNQRYLCGSKESINQKAIKESAAKIFKKGSLLIGMYDTAAFKLGILGEDSSANQACANIEPNKKKVEIDWLYSAFEFMKDRYLANRRGVRQKNLNLGMIKNFQLPLPPLETQKEFCQAVRSIENLEKKMKSSETELQNLFNCLMQKAFKGELF